MNTPTSASNKLQKPRKRLVGDRRLKNPSQLPLLNLLSVPKRLLLPPKGNGKFSKVGSFETKGVKEISLEDVIDNKFLSPISLRDFEASLAFTQHSAENLYFILWLKEYEKEYSAWKKTNELDDTVPENLNTHPDATRLVPNFPLHLQNSLSRALEAFFCPNAPLELNLPDITRDKIRVAAGNTGNPSGFEEAKLIIELSLKTSLDYHLKHSQANAGPRRLVFCFLLGLTVALLSLIPILVGIYGNHSRAWRVVGLPFIMFGSSVSAMALQRICGVIWLLGEDRQLLPYDSAPPTLLSGSLTPITSHTSSFEEKGESEKSENSSKPHPWEYQLDLTETIPTYSSSVRSSSYGSIGSSLRPSKVWAPVTSVESPEVIRKQWAIVIKSFIYGTVVMIIVGIIVLAVPNQ